MAKLSGSQDLIISFTYFYNPVNSSEVFKMGKDIVIERVFDAPVGEVWAAWSDPMVVKRWWGPKGFTAPHIKIDFRQGGKYLFCMRGSPGPGMGEMDLWSTGTYKEIVPNKKIVATDSFSDSKGNIVPSSYYGMEGDYPLEFLLTVNFEENKGKTIMTIKHEGFPPGDDMVLARQGFNESFDKLEEAIPKIIAKPGQKELVITQVYDAPLKKVFSAYTDPKLIPRWWGPRYLSTKVDKMDVKNGGEWRFVQKDPDGKTYAFHGTYKKIVPMKQIVQTFEFEETPGHVSVETAKFSDAHGKTKVVSKAVFSSVEDRDAMIASGMELGVLDSSIRMAELLSGGA